MHEKAHQGDEGAMEGNVIQSSVMWLHEEVNQEGTWMEN
jgi:hypothetical protein